MTIISGQESHRSTVSQLQLAARVAKSRENLRPEILTETLNDSVTGVVAFSFALFLPRLHLLEKKGGGSNSSSVETEVYVIGLRT